MGFSESFFASRFGITRGDLESYLAEALSQGGDYADVYFEYLSTSHISIDESIIKSAAEGVSLGVGVRVIAGERTLDAFDAAVHRLHVVALGYEVLRQELAELGIVIDHKQMAHCWNHVDMQLYRVNRRTASICAARRTRCQDLSRGAPVPGKS